ncbi:histidine-type phosphatase [Chromatiaceae bacterium AAb-1]|nr:histidine-type phosphatase [Chromatiaceae bacterium AAb-1]
MNITMYVTMQQYVKPCLVAGALLLTACSPQQPVGTGVQAQQDTVLGTTGFYASKTPYQPQQVAAEYEAAPAGFYAVMVQHVARHGSRGLSSPDDDDLSLQLWLQAQQENALTSEGETFGELLVRFQQASGKLGYGNLSRLGELEHQQMAERFIRRQPQLLAQAIKEGRRISVQHSGRERADDSATHFVKGLQAGLPEISALIDAAEVSHQTLYFHKAEGEDTAAYLAYRKADPRLIARLGSILALPQTAAVATAMLQRLYSKAFVSRLAQGQYQFQAKDDDATLSNHIEAAQALYSLYSIASNLPYEGDWHFADYIKPEHAQWMAYLDDAESFYERGPAFAGDTVTYRMAGNLLADFFQRIDALKNGDERYVAALRFTHAQVLIPFAALLGIKDASEGLPAEQTYSYQHSNWRSAEVSPMAANVQWDVYRNSENRYLVTMFHHEKQTPFKADCKPYADTRYFYELAELKRCYGY